MMRPSDCKRARARRLLIPFTEPKGLIDTAISVQSANAIVRKPIEAGETARHHNAAIRLKNGSGNFPIRPVARIEAGVERAIRVEACDPIARDIVGESETAGSDHFAVRLGNDDIYRVVCPRRGDESGIELPGVGVGVGVGVGAAALLRRRIRSGGERNKEKATKRRAMHQRKHSISF